MSCLSSLGASLTVTLKDIEYCSRCCTEKELCNMLQSPHCDAHLISKEFVLRAGVSEDELSFLQEHAVKHFFKVIGYGRGYTVYVRIKFNNRSHWFNSTNRDLDSAIKEAAHWARRYIDVAPLAMLLNLPS